MIQNGIVRVMGVLSSPLKRLYSRNRAIISNPKLRNISGTLKEMLADIPDAEKPNVVFVLGGPGAGKGTQCAKIVDKFGFAHLSAGDLLREERNKPGSEFGELIEKHIENGTIVPVKITCSLIEQAILARFDSKKYFLIDGFPRNQENLDGWESQMKGKVNVLFVLFFDAPEDTCVQRCLKRGQAGSGRCDDNPESLKKRVVTYMKDTMPIINHYLGLNLIRKVDSSKTPEEVYEKVETYFNQIKINERE